MVVEVEEETHILWKKCVYLKYIYQYLKHINTHSTRQTKVIRPTSYYSIQNFHNSIVILYFLFIKKKTVEASMLYIQNK